MNYFKKNINRPLMKAVIMPLIYGKTSYSFAEDLKEFFAKGNFYPNDSTLIKLASQILLKKMILPLPK